MSKSMGLGITAAVFGVLAAAFGVLAGANASASRSYSASRWGRQTQDITTIPTVIALICLGAAILCVVLAVATRQPASTTK